MKKEKRENEMRRKKKYQEFTMIGDWDQKDLNRRRVKTKRGGASANHCSFHFY